MGANLIQLLLKIFNHRAQTTSNKLTSLSGYIVSQENRIVRIILGIIIGMLGVALAQGIVEYYFSAPVSGTLIDTGSRMIGAVTAGIFGAVAGAGIGFLASISSCPFPQSVILSLVLSFIASVVIWSMFGNLEQAAKQTILVLLIFGTIFGTIASLVNKNTN